MALVCLPSYGCRWEVAKRQRSVEAAQTDSRVRPWFIERLVNSRVHPLLDRRTAKSMNQLWQFHNIDIILPNFGFSKLVKSLKTSIQCLHCVVVVRL